MHYQGLESYSRREKSDPLTKRPGESEEAHQRRIAPFLRHAEAADVDAQEWEAHRARTDQPLGQGAGLFGRAAPTERAEMAGGTHGFGGYQQIERKGHLGWEASPGQPGVRRIYAADLADPPAISPLVAYFRGSGQ